MIEKELILLDAPFTTQEEVVKEIIEKAVKLGYVNDQDLYYNEILKREEMIPTSVGFKVAIPHGRTSAVNQPFIAFMRTKEAFIWDEKNGEEVDFIFMIGIPEENKDNLHLKCLSLISKKLMQEEFRNELRNAKTAEDAFQMLDQINKSIKERE